MSTKWDQRFLELADHIAQWSKDPSTKVGCVIVGSDREILTTGFNGFPRGIEDTEERLNNRELKYPIICHGEENAILHAARNGVSLRGATVYVTPFPPCSRCARTIIQVGVSRVVIPEAPTPDRWQEDCSRALSLFDEAEVKIDKVEVQLING